MKRIYTLFIILTLLSAQQIFSQENIALNKPYFASGEAVPNWNNLKKYANDGNMNTRWQGTESAGTSIGGGQFSTPSWWYTDLQSDFLIEGVKVYWEAAYAKGYTIDVSNNASNWVTVFTQNYGKGQEELVTFTPVSARYVRISIQRGNMQWYPSIWEFEVYKEGDVPRSTNYLIDFDNGLPTELSFLSPNPQVYTNTIATISGTDKALHIASNGQSGLPFVWDSIYTDLHSINGLQLSPDNKFIYLRYKADKEFFLKVSVKAKNNQIFEFEADTIPASPDKSVYWYHLNLPAEQLDNIKAFNLNIGTQNPANIYIDLIQAGSLTPAFKFGFTQPAKGAQFEVGDKVNLLTNANNGKIKYYLNGGEIADITTYPYKTSILNIPKGYHKIKAELYNQSNALVDSANAYVYVKHDGGSDKLDYYTANLYQSLKAMAKTGHTMFGMANPTTIGYNAGPQNADYNTSDSKDITGSHPGFHESDFMWYDNEEFKRDDIIAMKDAFYRGAVIGYCWHLAGPRSGKFYAKVNGSPSADYNLVSEILASTDRNTNAMLDWYLSELDNMVIPVFKDLAVPVVFRPFHEMTGDWFWWGKQVGNVNYIRIYQLTVKYLRDAGLKNVLYAWSPDGDANFQFYPGDAYVDILGYDVYEPGIVSWASHTRVKTALTTLINYANEKDKVAAWTETGCRANNGTARYPNTYYDFWTKYVWDFTHNDPILRQLAWIESWYNANWSNSSSGSGYIPHQGMNMPNSDKAVADFLKMYNYPTSIFENDMFDMYGMSSSTDAFIYPQQLILVIGETYDLVGGSMSGWFTNEDKLWTELDPTIATVDNAGLVTAIKVGTTRIEVTVDGKSSSMQVEVVEEGSTAVSEESAGMLKIFPNPASQNGFTLYADNNSQPYQLTIFTASGQQVYSEASDKIALFVNTSGFEKGLYLVKMQNETQTITSKLMVTDK